MALKRVLPSRLTGALPPTGATVAPVSPPAAAPENLSATNPVAATTTPLTPPSISVPESPLVPPASTFAAAAASAFSTLPSANQPAANQPPKPARVLEDSFISTPTTPAVAEPTIEPLPTPQPAPQPVAAAAIPAPAIPTPEIPVPTIPMAAEVAPEATPQGPTDFLTPALQASKPTANPLKRKVGQTAALPPAKPAASTSAPTTPKAATASNTPSPEKKSNTAQATPQSKPRRTTTPRNFAAATVASPESKSSARMALEGTLAMASNVPIDTRPLHRVDEELIASGILAAPKGDSLTSQVPVGVAESESFMNFAAEPEPTPFKTPAPIAEAPKPAPMAEAPKPSPIAEASKPVSTAEKKPVAESLKPIIPPTITPLPPVQSNLPWVPAPQAAEGETTGNSWDVPAPAAASSSIAAAPTTPATSTPPADFFKPILTTQAPTGTSTTPPWSQMQGKAGFPPPELPGARNRNALQKGGTSGMLWGAGALAAAVIALVVWNHQQANITLPQQINQIANLGQTQTTQSDTTNSTGATGFSAVDFKSSLTPPIATNSVDSFPPAQPPEQSNSTAQIAFTDVPPEQATGPIVADGDEKMPEDVSVFARLQQAIAERKAEKAGIPGAPVPVGTTAGTPAAEGGLTPEKLQEELAAYRQALASGDLPQGEVPTATASQPAATPQPTAQPYMGANQLASTGQPGLLPPPSELYTNNPGNLPIVGEPAANAPARIRELADFQVEPFEPERPKVLIPRNLKPRLAATDFPSIEVLSFVPSRGIIAHASGREGVLLIGETIEGWELTNVTGEMAEFKAGQKSHYITAQN